MRKIFLLIGTLAALQLSAQKNDAETKSQTPPPPAREQAGPAGPGCNKDQMPQCGREEKGGMDKCHRGGESGRPGDMFINMAAVDKLNEKDRATFDTYMNDLKKATKPLMNELDLRHAELKYMVNQESPNMEQVDKKLDEIGSLEKKMQLEHIKFRVKVTKSFPSLGDDMREPR